MSRFIDSDTGPFALVPEWLLFARVPDRAKLVYAALARYADDGGESYPSRSTIATKLGYSEDTVDRGIRDLVKLGVLQVTLRIKNADGDVREGKPKKGLAGWEATSSLYRLRRMRLPEVAPEPARPRVGADTSPRGCGPNETHINETHSNETIRARRSRFPADYTPSDQEREAAEKAGMNCYTRRVEFEKFKDHHVAKGSLMVDWSAAWRTWCGNWQSFGAKQAADPSAPCEANDWNGIGRPLARNMGLV